MLPEDYKEFMISGNYYRFVSPVCPTQSNKECIAMFMGVIVEDQILLFDGLYTLEGSRIDEKFVNIPIRFVQEIKTITFDDYHRIAKETLYAVGEVGEINPAQMEGLKAHQTGERTINKISTPATSKDIFSPYLAMTEESLTDQIRRLTKEKDAAEKIEDYQKAILLRDKIEELKRNF